MILHLEWLPGTDRLRRLLGNALLGKGGLLAQEGEERRADVLAHVVVSQIVVEVGNLTLEVGDGSLEP